MSTFNYANRKLDFRRYVFFSLSSPAHSPRAVRLITSETIDKARSILTIQAQLLFQGKENSSRLSNGVKRLFSLTIRVVTTHQVINGEICIFYIKILSMLCNYIFLIFAI